MRLVAHFPLKSLKTDPYIWAMEGNNNSASESNHAGQVSQDNTTDESTVGERDASTAFYQDDCDKDSVDQVTVHLEKRKESLREVESVLIQEIKKREALIPYHQTAAFVAFQSRMFELLKNSSDAGATCFNVEFFSNDHDSTIAEDEHIFQVRISDNGDASQLSAFSVDYDWIKAFTQASTKDKNSLGGRHLGLAMIAFFLKKYGQGSLQLQQNESGNGACIIITSKKYNCGEKAVVHQGINRAHEMIMDLFTDLYKKESENELSDDVVFCALKARFSPDDDAVDAGELQAKMLLHYAGGAIQCSPTSRPATPGPVFLPPNACINPASSPSFFRQSDDSDDVFDPAGSIGSMEDNAPPEGLQPSA